MHQMGEDDVWWILRQSQHNPPQLLTCHSYGFPLDIYNARIKGKRHIDPVAVDYRRSNDEKFSNA